MNALLETYRARINKLESSAGSAARKKQKKDAIGEDNNNHALSAAMQAVASLRDSFKEALAEADDRAAELERSNYALQIKLQESEERARQLQGRLEEAASGAWSRHGHAPQPPVLEGSIAAGGGGDVVPAANVERHIEGLSRAPSILAERHDALAASLQSAAAIGVGPSRTGSSDQDRRAQELALMHQKLLQRHVGLIMSNGQELKVREHTAGLAALSSRDAELAWFWFRGAIAALGGVLRGRTPLLRSPVESSPPDDNDVNIAWGDEDDDDDEYGDRGSSSEEDEEPGTQQVATLEPFLGHVPHWKNPHRERFIDLEPFSSITRHPEDYCGPSDESNWVLPDMLLVGAFPGCPDDDENWELITGILSLGVTTFVCLQDEYSDDAPEEDWRNEQNGAIRPYFRDVRDIVQQVEADPHGFPQIKIASSDLHFVHFPIIDCDIGEDSDVYRLAVDLVARCARGEVLYLHCWGGHGRTGSLVCIMLHLMYGLSSQQAMERCQFVHDLRRVPMDVPSPQKPSQRNQVRRIIGALEQVADAAEGAY